MLQTQSDSFVKYCFNFLVFTQVYFPELEKEYNKKKRKRSGIKVDFLFRFMKFRFILGATASDSLSAGYRTILIDDCCRGVDLNDIEATKDSILGNHGVIVQSKEVRNIICLRIFKI